MCTQEELAACFGLMVAHHEAPPLSERAIECAKRVFESLPVLGCCVGGVYGCTQRRSGEWQRACISSAIGLIPGLNIWRLLVALKRTTGAKRIACVPLAEPRLLRDWMAQPEIRSKSLTELTLPGEYSSQIVH